MTVPKMVNVLKYQMCPIPENRVYHQYILLLWQWYNLKYNDNDISPVTMTMEYIYILLP